MKIKFILLLIALYLAPGLTFAQTASIDSLVNLGVTLENNANEEGSLTEFLAALKLSPMNYAANWHASFLYSKIGNRQTNDDTKKQDFVLAKQYAVRALKINPDDAESNYVMAVAMGRMALLVGGKEKVEAANEIKKYVDLALKSNPSHAASWHVLGKWHYEIANLNWIEKEAAQWFLGGIDGSASLAEAVNCYKKAIALNSTYILYYLDLSMAYVQLDDKANAIAILNKALALPAKTEDDPAYIKQCKALLAKLNQ